MSQTGMSDAVLSALVECSAAFMSAVTQHVLHPANLCFLLPFRHRNRLPTEGGHSNKPARLQELFRQCSKKYGLIFGWPCEEPEAGLDDLRAGFTDITPQPLTLTLGVVASLTPLSSLEQQLGGVVSCTQHLVQIIPRQSPWILM